MKFEFTNFDAGPGRISFSFTAHLAGNELHLQFEARSSIHPSEFCQHLISVIILRSSVICLLPSVF